MAQRSLRWQLLLVNHSKYQLSHQVVQYRLDVILKDDDVYSPGREILCVLGYNF